MVKMLLETIIKTLNQVQWPSSSNITDSARETYYMGIDAINTYRGNPDDLIGAINLFVSSGVLSYALAGSALVLVGASYVQGNIYEFDGLNKAYDLLNRAKKISPNIPEIDWIEPIILINKKQHEKAREALDHLQKIHQPHLLISSAEMAYWSEFNLQQTEKWFHTVMKFPLSKRQEINALNSMAAFYWRANAGNKALEIYLRITQLDPNDPWLWHNISLIYLNNGQYVDAYECNRIALQIMDFGAAHMAGEAIRKSLEISSDLENSKKNLKTDPEHAIIYLQKIADGYMALKQFEKAIESLTEVIRLRPNDAEAFNQRGRIFLSLNQFDQAIADLSKAIKINPKSAIYYFYRGQIYYSKRDPKHAISDYSSAIKLRPDYFEAFLNRGNCYKALRQYKLAIADYSKAINIKPKAIAARINLGITYISLSDGINAKKEFETALAMTDDPKIRSDIQRRLEPLNKNSNLL